MRRNLALRLTIYSPVSKWENPFPIVLHADDRPNFLAEFLPLASLLCRHLALDDADDGHEDGAAHNSGDGIPKSAGLLSFIAAPATFPPTAPLIT
jgi:hypothetical protein